MLGSLSKYVVGWASLSILDIMHILEHRSRKSNDLIVSN